MAPKAMEVSTSYKKQLARSEAASHCQSRTKSQELRKCSSYLESKGAGEAFTSLEHNLLRVTALGKRLALASSADPMQPPQKQHLAHYFNQSLLKHLLCKRQ